MISTFNYASIIKKIELYSCEQLIKSPEWQLISDNIVLLLECMKKEDFEHFDIINTKFYNYEEFSYQLFKSKTPKIELIPEHLLKNESFIYKILENFPHHFSLIPEKYLNSNILNWFFIKNKDLIIHTEHLTTLSRDMVSILLTNNYLNFQFLPLSYRQKISVFESIDEQYYPEIFKFAGEHVVKNPYIIQHVISKDPSLYKYIDESLKLPQYFTRFLAFSPSILEYAPPIIKDNEVCVLESVFKKPENLKHASRRLLSLPSFAYQLCSKMKQEELKLSFSFWDYTVRNNKEFISSLLFPLSEADCIQYLSDELKNDKDFMKQVITQDIKNFQFLGEKLNNDFEYITEVLEATRKKVFGNKTIYEAFEFIPDKLFESPHNLVKIYNKFTSDFEKFIYPKIKYKNTQCIKELNDNLELRANGIQSYFEKIKLYDNLEKTLSSKKHHEIHKI